MSRALHPRQFGGVYPDLLDPAALQIDGGANPRGRQVLMVQPRSGDGFSAVRVGLCATCRYAVRLCQGLVQDTSLDPGWDGAV
jgi:hypothetical protein